MNIAITGANGFVGKVLVEYLKKIGISVTATVRNFEKGEKIRPTDVRYIEVGNIDGETDWITALAGVEVVIHCAARTNLTHEKGHDTLTEYRNVNVLGLKNLVEQAVSQGVRRLIYLSSIKVNGEQTEIGQPYLYSDEGSPEDHYAISKFEAEQTLWKVSENSCLEVVVIRPPLVYGPGVSGNLLRLLQLIDRRFPLPLGLVDNARSFVALDNLIDLMVCCINHPEATGKTFLVSDGNDLSSPDLIRKIAFMMGKSPRLISLPVPFIRLAGKLIGKRSEVDRLVGSLQVDIKYTQETLDWSPPLSLDEGLQKTVYWYMKWQ